MSIWSDVFGSETIAVTEPVTTEDAHGAPKRSYRPEMARTISGVDVQAAPTEEDTSHREGEHWTQKAYMDAAAAESITKHARIEWRGAAYRLYGPIRIVTGAGLLPDTAVLDLQRWEG